MTSRPTCRTTRASRYLEFLQDVLHKEYLELLERRSPRRSSIPIRTRRESLFQKLPRHAEAYVNKTRVKDRNTKEELQPDEGFLELSIEAAQMRSSARRAASGRK